MIGNVVSRRYAEALFSIGKEAGLAELERYGASLASIGEAIEKTPQLAEAFRNPVLSSQEKKKVVLSLLEIAGGSTVEQNFCALLAEKDRLSLLPSIASDFMALLDNEKGISRGMVTTAIALDNKYKKTIKEKLELQTGRKLELEYAVDSSIIGGVILRVGDSVYDASLRAQLENLRNSIKRGE